MGSTGLITYMRTDSTRIANEALADARTVITSLFTPKHLPEAPRLYGKGKNAQDAHEAIRPSQVNLDYAPNKIKDWLSKDQFRLYELIWKRFLASQMENAVFDAIRVDVTSGGCVFRANGSMMKFDGFLALYDETVEENVDNSEGENERLPDLQQGMAVTLRDLTKRQHFTQPPPRYTEASLVRDLEDKGIGRPSTYAQIIDTLKKRKYVTAESRRFAPTEVGFMVKNILVKQFPDIFDVQFTAEMELGLDKVEDGESEWTSVLEKFYAPFKVRLQAVITNIKDLRAQNQEITDRTCPQCNKFPLVMKWSKNGRFLACQGFPACKYTEPLEKVQTVPSDEKCDKCGAPMVILTIKGNRFLGCSRYPECRNTRSLSTGVHCPTEGCAGMIVEKRTRRGKFFYGCSKYPACTFASWDKPVDKKCAMCGFPILLQKDSKRKGSYLYCFKCKDETPLAEPAAAEQAGDLA
jgi:DNA topoisomerase I